MHQVRDDKENNYAPSYFWAPKVKFCKMPVLIPITRSTKQIHYLASLLTNFINIATKKIFRFQSFIKPVTG